MAEVNLFTQFGLLGSIAWQGNPDKAEQRLRETGTIETERRTATPKVRHVDQHTGLLQEKFGAGIT